MRGNNCDFVVVAVTNACFYASTSSQLGMQLLNNPVSIIQLKAEQNYCSLSDCIISLSLFLARNLQWNMKIFPLISNSARIFKTGMWNKFSSPLTEFYLFAEPTTTIFGGPEMHVHEGSPLNISCVVHNSVGQPEFFFWKHNGNVNNLKTIQ